MTVPTDALVHINIPGGGNKVDLSPMDSDGNRWPFRCYTRLNGHPKPAFTTGWLDFVRAKGLQIGDKVTFSKLEDDAGGAPQYRIHASRLGAIKLMGAEVKARLTVPTDALAHINIPGGGNKVDLSPMDSDGNRWPFRCYTRLNGHPKPAFTTGWLAFVRAKGLQIGDKVTFSKLEDDAGGAPQYRIHASRLGAIKLMGAEVKGWADLP
ncbi:hypothetical protein EZV62_006194 [Acer yangbiense]|uniref:TF-B3 domain-containing protein n=1 Tax=Acer yangbiense TaxID=1000413 RepID=A0A5C7IQ84_9ROSI|nr:hypothetical protein EZV62_006194 [Acer yangbiense]